MWWPRVFTSAGELPRVLSLWEVVNDAPECEIVMNFMVTFDNGDSVVLLGITGITDPHYLLN